MRHSLYKKVRRLWGVTANAFMHAVFPGRCIACGELFRPKPRTAVSGFPDRSLPLTDWVHRLFSSLVCPLCITDFHPVDTPKCSCCGIPFKGGQGEDHLCGECIDMPKHFATARAAGRYEGMFRSVIHGYKYGGNTRLAEPLGRLMWETVMRHMEGIPFNLMLPVPLHPGRMRQRGFNQAYLLLRQCQFIQGGAGIRPHALLPIAGKLLIRTKPTPPQTGLGRKGRRKNMRNAFTVTHPKEIKGKTILLVDDVLTTGATVDACAKALVKNGAARVDVVTLARAV